MQFLRNLPVRHKLLAITMLVSSTALLVACVAFVLYEQAAGRGQTARALNLTAAIVAINSSPGLSSGEARPVELVLKSLSTQPDIIQACVYDQAGKPFVRYLRAGEKTASPPPVEAAGHHFHHQRLELFRPIDLGGKRIGTIYLEENLSPLTARLGGYFLIGALVLLVSGGIACVLSFRLHKVISEPFMDLARTVSVVRTERNYSVRAAKQGDDELCGLIDGFNEMLAQIEERDRNLERRVEARTVELAQSLSVLNATLGSTADGILVVNAQGEKIFQNQRTLELWKIPPDVAENLDDQTQIRHFMAATIDPAAFAERVAHYYSHPDENGHDEVLLNNGTILERITAPVRDKEGRNYGRIWTFRDVTKTKNYEAVLRESQARFKFIFESVPVGIASHMVHPDGRVTREVNDAHLRICGLTREQHDGPDIYATLIHPQDQPRQQNLMRQVNAGKIRQFSMEKRYLRRDGSLVWVVFSFQRQHYADGGYEELTTLVDITESKGIEQSLRESQANYHSLVDQMPAGVFRKDKDGRYVFVNSWFCRLKGVKAEDYLGKLPQEITAGTDVGLLPAEASALAAAGNLHHADILETGRKIEFDEKCTGANGAITYFHAVKSPVFGPDGAIVGTQGILMDVTQRKLMETELAYERDLLRALMENSTDHIYFKDAQSRFIKSSHSQARQFGVASADELIGKSDFDFFSEEHARPAYEEEQQIIRTGQPMIGKIERETWQDGRPESWVLTTKIPFRNRAGEIIGTFGISKDITPIKIAEAQVAAANRQLLETSRLAGMAEVATSVLHNVGNVLNSVNVSTTLVLDLVKKSRLNNLGRLAALVHEQRHDLAAFFTTDPRGAQLPDYLNKLVEHLAAEQAQVSSEVELTRKNIEHIKDIVTMQQTYAKVAGVVEKVKVTDLVEDSLRMNAGAMIRHQIEVVRDYPPAAIECNVDRQKVLQILINLIRNAKYACDESGRPDKQLIMRVRAGDGRTQIIVQDNGVGIPAENMTRIFSHGFTTRQTGHGFGLHSGALAARELGGSLTAFSDGPGTGARFVLELPLQPLSASQSA